MKKASGRLLFLVAYFAYASIYIARLNLTVASPVMQSEKLMNAAQIGTMGGIFFLFYSAGQPVQANVNQSTSASRPYSPSACLKFSHTACTPVIFSVSSQLNSLN